MAVVCNQMVEAEASEQYHYHLLQLKCSNKKKNQEASYKHQCFSSPSPCLNHF
ncbi:hypothetical protein AAZX31_11G239900 [Glycine max]